MTVSVVHLHISANLVVIIILLFPMSFLLEAFIDVELLRSGCGKKQYDSNSFTANIANQRQPYNVIFSGMTKKFPKNAFIVPETRNFWKSVVCEWCGCCWLWCAMQNECMSCSNNDIHTRRAYIKFTVSICFSLKLPQTKSLCRH